MLTLSPPISLQSPIEPFTAHTVAARYGGAQAVESMRCRSMLYSDLPRNAKLSHAEPSALEPAADDDDDDEALCAWPLMCAWSTSASMPTLEMKSSNTSRKSSISLEMIWHDACSGARGENA